MKTILDDDDELFLLHGSLYNDYNQNFAINQTSTEAIIKYIIMSHGKSML